MCNKRKPYPTDVKDKSWSLIAQCFPETRVTKPRKYEQREIVNAIFYIVRGGNAWRMMPNDLPPWRLVYFYFWFWKGTGLWEAINAALVEASRKKTGRRPKPSMALLDSQSVRSANGGEAIGIDGHKKINGRKRHLVTDTVGNILAVEVTAANVSDQVGGHSVLEKLASEWTGQHIRLRKILADKAYTALIPVVRDEFGWCLDTPDTRPAGHKGFFVQKHRWVIERTNAWQLRYRRLVRDFEHTVSSSVAMSYLASIHRLAMRL
jgi:putative transposase